ncbi:DUF2332 domain-containing protein [Bacillus sp. AK031]
MLSETFKRFADNECKGSSDLYERLSLEIANDDEILELSANAGEGQPVPNLLFGAVHYLLLKGKDHPLKDYYPSIAGSPKSPEEAFSAFKNFSRIHREEIIKLLKTKLVQTNEVRRCAYLYPVFSHIFNKTNKPLAMIEIGTSAGLQLLWDQYSYSYGTGKSYGNQASDVKISASIKGRNVPDFLDDSPPVSHRIGLDLHINDLADEEDYLWLNALIWPEHQDRRKLFEKAAEHVKAASIEFIEGDGIEMLPQLSKNIPADSVLCVFHTHVANQIPREGKEKLLEEIKRIGQERDVFHIYNNITDRDLHLDYYFGGEESKNTIGRTEGHGKWFEWNLV